jgi:chemotaxis protein CheZ
MQPAQKQSITREKVGEVIATVVSRLGDKMSGNQVKIAWELEQLAKQIDQLYAELSSLNPNALKGDHIPSAHDELMAVVAATGDATTTIMDSCDAISKVAGTVPPEQGGVLTEQVNKIYEACSFQDITGQRITKVVKTLKLIEEKIDGLISTVGISAVGSEPDKRSGDEALLNGPALPNQAISQEEIDKLLGF